MRANASALAAGRLSHGYSRLSEIPRSGLTRDATYLGQTMAP